MAAGERAVRLCRSWGRPPACRLARQCGGMPREYGLGQLRDGAVTPAEPSGAEGDAAEGIAANVTKQAALFLLLGFLF